MSLSSQASEISIAEEETANSSGYGSGVATPGPRASQTTIVPAPIKSQKHLDADEVIVPTTERSPLLPRRVNAESHAKGQGHHEEEEVEWTWWDEFKTLISYLLPVYGYGLLLFLRAIPSP